MKNISLLLSLLFVNVGVWAQDIKSPDEFLGYELGSKFTYHHRIVDYFKYVAEHKDNVLIEQYGTTYEGRPLVKVVLSSSANMSKLEEIRLNNLKRTGLMSGTASDDGKAIVWLSYNIHGNEASSSEATMRTLYELASGSNEKANRWLENTVVIIDPCVNPDGRDRYANFYNQYGALPSYNAHIDAAEHREPWPGGRPNHYLFDLNRDWAWQSQVESKQRMKAYSEWMPHVHVDFHEQGYNSPYYFAPAAEPFHEVITDWQREFQTEIGKNHARYFDAENWVYFTRERFDLFYPSYGDTYPTYNGAIGMTYEQAGHSLAGLGIITSYGDTLTLKDRLLHHHTTGMSTIEIAAENAMKLSNEFKKFFDDNQRNPKAKYKAYVIKATSGEDKLRSLQGFLDQHHIYYGSSNTKRILKGYAYHLGEEGSSTLAPDDMVINVAQPKAALITAMFEPESKLTDSLTYDITAWAIPFAFGLEAYAIDSAIPDVKKRETKNNIHTGADIDAYAYVVNYQSFEDAKMLAALLKEGVRVRMAPKAFSVQGQRFEKGALVIAQRNNEHIKQLGQKVSEKANELGRKVYAVRTGFVDYGHDFGSNDLIRINAPKIAVLSGEGSSSLSYGEVWHYFEQQLGYPITSLRTDYFDRVDLTTYDVLIVPSGYYGNVLDDTGFKKIDEWVKEGGKLILMQAAISSFASKDGFAIKNFTDEEKKQFEEKDKDLLQAYHTAERRNLSNAIFGAVYKVRLDNSHPLAYGYEDYYMSLKTSSARYTFLENGWNVGVLQGKTAPLSGFAGHKANRKLENSLVFGVQPMGRGQVVYLVDDPLFRAFWENGRLLFSNAVFLVGN